MMKKLIHWKINHIIESVNSVEIFQRDELTLRQITEISEIITKAYFFMTGANFTKF